MAQQYKNNGLIVIAKGLAQPDPLEIDSPIIELEPSTISGEGVNLGMKYTYQQGTVNTERNVNHFIPMEDMNEEEIAAILLVNEMANKRLLKMYPNAIEIT